MALGSVNVPGVSATELEAVRLQAITATQNAEAAGNLAAGAKSTADAALGAANAAAGAADTAKTTADSALTAANAANSKATESKTTADSALVAANEAKTAAENAATAAANAQKAADDAAKAVTDLNSTINTVPSQNGTPTYTGSAITPSWNGFDTEKLTIGGTTTGTNVGEYSATFTPKSGFKWPDGSTTAKTVKWRIARAVVAVPTQSGSPAYTGAEQTASFSGYDSAKMTRGGTVKGTNAGTYSATFTPGANYCWPDGTTTAKTVNWTISKAAGSLSISPTSLTIEGVNATKTIAVTRSGDGTISATSSNTSIATVSVSGNTITVTGKASGTVTITVKVEAGTNHTAPANKTCSATVSVPHIYGASWDGSSTTKWTRTDAAAGFTDPVPYTAGKTAAQCSSPFDNLQPWAGMTKSNRTGGVMVAIPKFWYKLTQNGSGMKVQIADKATSGFSVSPAHMNRGDGKGERDVVYIGRYHCASDYKSKTGVKPGANFTRSTARSGIHALGSNIWQNDFAMRFTLWLLYIVEFADWNTQKTIGKGCGNNSGTENMGYTDSMPYHTGTTQSSRDTYGLGTQYRNIEGLWDNVYDWCDGCYNNSNGLNIILNPNSFSDSSGGTSVGTPCNGWPAGFTVSNAGGFPMFYGSKTGGSETTYSCDCWGFGASYPCVYVGGNYDQYGYHGLFCVGYSSVSFANASIGSRLQELP